MTLMLGWFAEDDRFKTQQDLKEWIGSNFECDPPAGEIVAASHTEPDYEESCWFLLKIGEDYFEATGSHCSCYGYEGQWELKPASLEYLTSNNFGGWCLEPEEKAQVKALLQGC